MAAKQLNFKKKIEIALNFYTGCQAGNYLLKWPDREILYFKKMRYLARRNSFKMR